VGGRCVGEEAGSFFLFVVLLLDWEAGQQDRKQTYIPSSFPRLALGAACAFRSTKQKRKPLGCGENGLVS